MGDLIVGAGTAPIHSIDALHRFLSHWPLGEALELRGPARHAPPRRSLGAAGAEELSTLHFRASDRLQGVR